MLTQKKTKHVFFFSVGGQAQKRNNVDSEKKQNFVFFVTGELALKKRQHCQQKQNLTKQQNFEVEPLWLKDDQVLFST